MHEHDTDLASRFAEIVEGQGLDLDRLTAASRRDGTRLRTRRRLVTATSALAVVAVVGAGAALAPRPGGTAPGDAAGTTGTTGSQTPTPSASPSPTGRDRGLDVPTGPRSPVTGRGTAVALSTMVNQLADGEASGFAGQGQAPADGRVEPAPTTYARLTWTPASGGAGTPVMINVQNDFGPDEPDQRGAMFFSCRDDRLRCTVDREDGMTVVSYEVEHGDAVDRHVDVFHRASTLRVSIASTNASEFEKTDAALRKAPPLSTAVLRAIATDDVWGVTLPREWEEAGERLSPYLDLDSSARRASASSTGVPPTARS